MKKKTVFWFSLIVLSVAAALMASHTLGRFSSSFSEDPQPVEPAALYFEATLADGQTYYVAEGEDLSFTVRNYDALEHVTATEIAFDVRVGGAAFSSHTLTASTMDSVEVSIPAAQLGAAGSVLALTLAATTPYEQTLTFTIRVVAPDAVNCYSITDKGDYVQLDLYLGGTLPAQDILVQYTGFAPDSTNDLTAAWTVDDGEGTLACTSLVPNARYTFYFFGKNAVSERSNEPLSGSISLA